MSDVPEDYKYRWEIEPTPYSRGEFDVFGTDSDTEALAALKTLAEQEWDDIEPGQERTIKVRFNGPALNVNEGR